MVLKKQSKKIITLTIFAIAMALLEAIVVIYLRKLYYPQGFTFPLTSIISDIFGLEVFREISTIVILICIAIIAGKIFYQRFAYFLYVFGIWDIFYYIWLKIIINWPSSFLTWDVLFLIPVPWLAPIIAPLINSLTMTILALFLIYFPNKKINLYEWLLIIIGFFIIFFSFIWEYSKLIINNFILVSQFVPSHFNWILFIIGEILILFMFVLFIKRK